MKRSTQLWILAVAVGVAGMGISGVLAFNPAWATSETAAIWMIMMGFVGFVGGSVGFGLLSTAASRAASREQARKEKGGEQ